MVVPRQCQRQFQFKFGRINNLNNFDYNIKGDNWL